jgi:hypothetical protein
LRTIATNALLNKWLCPMLKDWFTHICQKRKFNYLFTIAYLKLDISKLSLFKIKDPMKIKIQTFLYIGLMTLLLSMSKCETRTEYTAYNPVFMKRADLEKSISVQEPREIFEPAKIYTKDNYLFVSEAGLGVHVVDNSNPSLPKKLAFIKVLGCFDMAIKGSVLYVDNATDLVALDLLNPTQAIVVQRIVNAFPEPLPPDNLPIRPEHEKQNRPSDLVLVKWNKS